MWEVYILLECWQGFIVVILIAIIKNDYIIFGKKEVLNYFKTIFVDLLIIYNMYINMESRNNIH